LEIVCAIEHTIREDDNTDEITEVIPIAGELGDYGGYPLDAKFTRLKTADPQDDDPREGLEIELHGGVYGDDKRKQKAIIEFLCEAGRTGLETDLDPPDNYDSREAKVDEIGPSSLHFVSYQAEGDIDTLRLKWYTKHACEESAGDGNGSKNKHWGFFTWFLIM
jgi:autophagy-related protein 27